jgi:outer membrane protein TolC
MRICRLRRRRSKVAQSNALAQRGLFFPQVTGNSTSSSLLLSNAGTVFGDLGSVPQTQFSLVTNQLTVSFVPDIWGGNFRAVENLDAVTEQQLFLLEAAYLTLTSNVVTAAIQEASFRGQIAATQRIIVIERNLLDILKRQFGLGQVAKADVLSQEAALAAAEQLLPPLQKQLALQRDLLTALAGQFSAHEIEQKFDLAHLKLPANLPISLPGKLVDQRPDVRAAEANMHAASAQVGVTIAARLPNILLSANGGSTGYNFAQVPDFIRWRRARPRRSSTASRSITGRNPLNRRWSWPKPSIAPPSSPHSRTSRTRCGPCSRMRAPSGRPATPRTRQRRASTSCSSS